LADDSVLDLLASIRRVAEHNLAEVDRVVRDYFDDRDSMEPVSRADLMDRMKLGLVTILGVRPTDEFALGHLPGALNVQLSELERRLAKLDKSKEIVAYCRGPYCVLSYEAVALLRARGFKVRRLEDGLPEWRAAGLPVVTVSRHASVSIDGVPSPKNQLRVFKTASHTATRPSAAAVAKYRPPWAHSQRRIGSVCSHRASCRPDSTSKATSLLLTPPAATNRVPSGENWMTFHAGLACVDFRVGRGRLPPNPGLVFGSG
jgi:rhodanese-related sulfurtransferase